MSYGDDLWIEASADHEALAKEAALARADAELDGVMPFLLASRSPAEYGHRRDLAWDSLCTIAARCGLEPGDLAGIADRRFVLYREALAEGVDPLQEVADCSQASGGPEKPDEHSTGPAPDAYSEVPPGPTKGPDPRVTQVRPPELGPVTEATGSLRKQADGGSAMMTMPYTPPDLGTGAGSTDIGTPGANTNDMTPSLPTGGPAGQNTPDMPVTTTASADPVRRKVLAVTAAIRETNPALPVTEAERVARKVVGRYMTADLDSSVMEDDPGSPGQGGGSGSGGGLGHVIQHGLEWQGLKGMMPGGAGGAAGGAGLIGDAAELAAL